MNKQHNDYQPYVSPGMPPLDLNGPATSFFEFWPIWLLYIPVALQWLLLAIWYRSLSLPLIANPAIPLSGMVGVHKSAVFDAAGSEARRWILPWLSYELTSEPEQDQLERIITALDAAGLTLPLVAKPEFGCRGMGVKLLKSQAELRSYLSSSPVGGAIQFQHLSQWDAEAGVFYVRHPSSEKGEVTSLALKYLPYVVGDGVRSLAQLVAGDPRAGELIHLYQQRHAQNWDRVLPAGEPYRLIFAASHSRGAIFREASELITDELTQSLDKIFADIPDYFYGRLDVKFKDVDSLRAGKDFEIIEINGASSESINIWDHKGSILNAVSTLLQQYRTLFKLGHANRKRGHKPPGLWALIKAWRFETNLVGQYPDND